MKNVQIPYELFMLLIRHYLVEDDTCLDEIRQGLEKKLDSLVQHELYGKFKTETVGIIINGNCHLEFVLQNLLQVYFFPRRYICYIIYNSFLRINN